MIVKNCISLQRRNNNIMIIDKIKIYLFLEIIKIL